MLHVVQSASRPLADEVLRSMFAARKAVFVDLLHWDVPVVEGRFEIDQFDDAHAIYLVVCGHDGGHHASARLLPTVRPHILGELFPQLCADGPPRGQAIYEITRFCLDRRLSARERLAARNELVTAIADFALAHAISAYTAIAEVGWVQQILSFGWRCAPLGVPLSIEGTALAALRIEIDAETPALLAAGLAPRSLAPEQRSLAA